METINASEFMDQLEKRGLVIAPRMLVESALQEIEVERKRRLALTKKALSFREITEAELWGNITQRAVKKYAETWAKEDEIFEVPKGGMKIKKIIIAAVKRIAKQRGESWI